MDDDDYEKFLASYGRMCEESTKRQVEEIREAEPEPVPEIADSHVILLGFDGQVDKIMRWYSRPDVLLLPLPMPRAWMLAEEDPGVLAPLRTAKYRRVGEFTYRRVS